MSAWQWLLWQWQMTPSPRIDFRNPTFPLRYREPLMRKVPAQLFFGYTKDIKHRHVEYEVQLLVGDHTKDVTIDPQGNILEVEEQVAPDALPVNVFHGLSEQARKGTLVKVESLTKHGKIVVRTRWKMAASVRRSGLGPTARGSAMKSDPYLASVYIF